MTKLSEIKEISNLQEFKEFYLQDAHHSFCQECNNIEYMQGNGFLEVVALEDLKKLQKNIFGNRTRRKFYSIILLTSGKTEETIGHRNYHFGAGTLYFVSENQLHSVKIWSEDVKGMLCMFDADYFLLCIKHQIKLNQFPFFQTDKRPYIQLSDREMLMMEHLLWKLNSEKCQKTTFNDDLLVRMFLNVILLEAERIYHKKTSNESFSLSRKEQLVAKFQLLVNQHFLDKKQVNKYADLLHVHPHYLNDVVKEFTGFPASHFIQKQLIQESKSRLVQTSDTVSMIATELQFTEDSYFGRFFKKQTGLTPLQYRKKHKH
ncbi:MULTISPECIES: AraC family transcriptional regulator [Elizabethkingia]|uniref:AraC family transcriptional regulator n=1 Tax=Elizabethkingia meningoseptica TaxID=238 RepID=A0A1T3FGD4_ELIME|nr:MULTISPECIES: helix-turn-helix domain-containing protein [Elizabethkingia]AQX12921.1 AraC family transcriptional regulator [Elizabethkingia meningoseptica]MBG0514450.1 helix-turn-helix domain-containing protein [Elizabethkingia meningoseptica]MDE5433365.1 helix-turn-helix domain-containing protein [Elizabethkingia meningoseptica]MDE5535863.1 helix-turn-helix domain-containing protein [Elizabethkingia meningoseptica]MDX8574702.1 helix-turn-helix domain-containing protein [Elizabethkingia sp.